VLERARIEDSRDIAIALRTATFATIRDTVVRRVLPDPDERGYGLLVAMGSTATIERMRIEEATTAGLIVGTDSSVQLSDVTVRATLPSSTGNVGRGVHVQGNGQLDGTRLSISDNREVGLIAALGGRVTVNGLTITGTRVRECAATGACMGEAGFGLAIHPTASIVAGDFVLAGNEIAGAVVAGGTLRLENGRIAGHPIGVSVQDMRDPSTVLGDAVLLVDNDLDFDATTLPLPSPDIGE
jgi:parallel beta helix pectate lyase-like protein